MCNGKPCYCSGTPDTKNCKALENRINSIFAAWRDGKFNGEELTKKLEHAVQYFSQVGGVLTCKSLGI
jgi:hypothetical protein